MHLKAEEPIYVGSAAKLLTLLEWVSPRLLDWFLLQGDLAFRNMLTDKSKEGGDNLFVPLEEAGSNSGDYGMEARKASLYIRHVELHPARSFFALAALVGLGELLWLPRR